MTEAIRGLGFKLPRRRRKEYGPACFTIASAGFANPASAAKLFSRMIVRIFDPCSSLESVSE